MFIFGVLLFAILTFVVSFLIANSEDLDKGRMAASASIISWVSLIYGLYLAKSFF